MPTIVASVPAPGGSGRNKLRRAEAAGLALAPEGRLGAAEFAAYGAAAGGLRYVSEPAKTRVGSPAAAARAVAALQEAGFAVRATDAIAMARLAAGAAELGGGSAEAEALLVAREAALAGLGRSLRPYQRDGALWLLRTPAGILADDMGLGKTVQALAAIGRRAVVFCPASAKGVWRREAAAWRPDLRATVIEGTRSGPGDGPSCAAGAPEGASGARGGDSAASRDRPAPTPPEAFRAPPKARAADRLGTDGLGPRPRPVPGRRECAAPLPEGCGGLGGEAAGGPASAPAPAPAWASPEWEFPEGGGRPIPPAFHEDRGADRAAGSFRWPAEGELVIVNYDVVRPEDVEAAGPAPSGTALLADEAHALTNAGALRSRAFREAAKAVARSRGQRWAITATPIGNRPLELRALLEAVGAFKSAFPSWVAFEAAFGGAVRSAEAEPSPEAAIALARVAMRRTKAEVARDLPPMIVAERRVRLAGASAEAAAELERALRPAVERALAAARGEAELREELERALRSASDIGEISAARRALALAKLPAAIELLEEAEAEGRPIVFASAHREPVEAVGSRPGWGIIAGGTPAEEREALVARFQAEGEARRARGGFGFLPGELRGIALTLRAGGEAITLTAAADMVCADLDWNPSKNEQLFARIHRIGQDRPCTVTLLRGDAWIEDRQAELLALKARMIRAVVAPVEALGGRPPPVPDLAAVARPAPPRLVPGGELLARAAAVAPALGPRSFAAWLVGFAASHGGRVPAEQRGRPLSDLVAASEAEARALENKSTGGA